MQPDVIRAAARNWRDQAKDWAREGEANPGGGHSEVAFLLERAARMAEACADGEAAPPPPARLPDPVQADLREG
jgi:hypothetical protein